MDELYTTNVPPRCFTSKAEEIRSRHNVEHTDIIQTEKL